MEEDIKILKDRIEYCKYQPEGCNWQLSFEYSEIPQVENILNRLEQQNNNINNTIKAIEILRQGFSEDLQIEFINLLNTLTGGEYLK